MELTSIPSSGGGSPLVLEGDCVTGSDIDGTEVSAMPWVIDDS